MLDPKKIFCERDRVISGRCSQMAPASSCLGAISFKTSRANVFFVATIRSAVTAFRISCMRQIVQKTFRPGSLYLERQQDSSSSSYCGESRAPISQLLSCELTVYLLYRTNLAELAPAVIQKSSNRIDLRRIEGEHGRIKSKSVGNIPLRRIFLVN